MAVATATEAMSLALADWSAQIDLARPTCRQHELSGEARSGKMIPCVYRGVAVVSDAAFCDVKAKT